MGHLAKACPQQRRGQSMETPGRQQSNRGQNDRNTTSFMTGKTNLADVQEALKRKTAMLHVLTVPG